MVSDEPFLPLDLEDESEGPQVLLVRVGEESLAIALEDVREVLRARPATRVPGAPHWVPGLVAVRGVALVVGDLTRRAGESGDAPWLVLVESGERRAALGVSAVDGVQPLGELADTPGEVRAALPRRGSARLLSQAAVDVLDVAALLDDLFEGE